MPRLDGIDGSHHQPDAGPVDLAAVRLIPTWWIAWKATQSDQYKDPTFATIRSSWDAFVMRGIYHWLSSSKDVGDQAAHFLRTIGILQVGEFVMLDAEEIGITVAGCLAWCELVEAVTRRPVVIYSGLYVAGGTIWNSPELRMSKYGPRPFIVAAYVSEANLRARMAALHALPFDGWQFSSNGPVAGITGRCDMDQIDNVAAFELACAISHIPTPIGDDDPMLIRLLVLSDSPARFLASCTSTGAALRCEWSGPADDSGTTNPRIEWFRHAFKPPADDPTMPYEMGPFTSSLLKNISLDDLLPPGFTADQFANTAAIEARMTNGTIDKQARAAVDAVGQTVDKLRGDLVKAGGGSTS